MPEDASEDEEVIMPMGGHLRNPSDHGQERPQPKERAWLRKERLTEEGLYLGAQTKERLTIDHYAGGAERYDSEDVA